MKEAANIINNSAKGLDRIWNTNVETLQTTQNGLEDREAIYSSRNNQTTLKQILSIATAGVSVFSQAFLGFKIQTFKGTIGDKWMNPSGIDLSRKDPIFLHQCTRSLMNLVTSAVNIPMFLTMGVKFPLLKDGFFACNEQGKKIAEKTGGLLTKYIKNPFIELQKKSPLFNGLTKGIAKSHEKWRAFINSNASYHAMLLGVGIVTVAMGPVGWGISAGAVGIDVTRGARKVNRVKVMSDQLNHLNSLQQSKNSIDKLEKNLTPEQLKQLEGIKPKIPDHLIQEKKENKNSKSLITDDLNKSVLKAIPGTVARNGLSLGVTLATAAANPVGAAVTTILDAMAWAGSSATQLGEQHAKDAMLSKITKLQSDMNIQSNPNQSRQYDIANTAYEHAVYECALRIKVENLKDPSYTRERIKEEAEGIIDKDPLFSKRKIKEPKGVIETIKHSTISTFSCLGNYLHPFKSATSYSQVYENYEEKKQANSQSNTLKQNEGRESITNSIDLNMRKSLTENTHTALGTIPNAHQGQTGYRHTI